MPSARPDGKKPGPAPRHRERPRPPPPSREARTLSQRSFFADMLTGIFERRPARTRTRDRRSLTEMCLALLDAEGEVSGLHLAQAALDRYAELDRQERRAFFGFLNDALEIDLAALDAAVRTHAENGDPESYRALSQAAEPRRQELLRRLNQPPGATRAIVRMRTDLLLSLIHI